MKVLKPFKCLVVINFSKFYEMFTLWFTVLKYDWRVAALLISFAFVSLYKNLACKNHSYFFKFEDVATRGESDVSLSVASMEPLLKIEQTLVRALFEHANKLQEKVDEIRSGISSMRRKREIYNIDVEDFLSRPLRSFPMLRRLKHEWKAWLEFMKEAPTNEYVEIIYKALRKVSNFDLTPSAEGIQHLCELYDIEPNDWIDGKLHLAELDMPFSTLDCYAIAFLLHKKRRYQAANTWFEAGLKSFKPRKIYKYIAGFSRADIYEAYVDNLLKQNRKDAALKIVANALLIEPTNLKLINLLSQTENFNVNLTASNFQLLENKNIEKIKQGCRGDFIENSISKLYCYYDWSTNDFVRLAPFKVELINKKPFIMLFHQVLNKAELSEFKVLAKQKLKNDQNFTYETDGFKTNLIQTSKNVWIHDTYDSTTVVLNKRLEDMTGLITNGSNMLLGNYGLGGYSIPHTDCDNVCQHSNDGHNESDDDANCDKRLATVLIYLSDVKSGGGTIFPELEVSIFPRKGAALFWYNFQNNVNACDNRTLHMACPVVVGSKWFLIKWISSKNQMFRSPCWP